jgi:hypothetical protein
VTGEKDSLRTSRASARYRPLLEREEQVSGGST